MTIVRTRVSHSLIKYYPSVQSNAGILIIEMFGMVQDDSNVPKLHMHGETLNNVQNPWIDKSLDA